MAVWAFAAVFIAQAAPVEMACWYSQTPPNHAVSKIIEGVIVTMRRSPDADAVEDGCTVEVRTNDGRVVFKGEGFNTDLHRQSGRDVDNDGYPDLVIGVDSGGGTRCCWEYSVLSLGPMPHLAGAFDDPAFESDEHGQTIVWTIRPFYDLGPSAAQFPTLSIAQQYRSSRFVEITAEYCAPMLAGRLEGWGDLKPELQLLTAPAAAASRAAAAKPSFEVDEIRVAAMTVALQMIYCGRGADARELIRRVWPEGAQERVRTALDAAAASVRRP